LLTSAQLRKVRGGKIGIIFQDPLSSLNPVLTVGNQIGEALSLHRGLKGSAARFRALELLDLVGIADAPRRLHQYPHELSGGMQQRVMIAAALACEPTLLIADEPTTALDVTIQAQILELLARLRADLGMAVLLITHDLGVVAGFADRINVMYAGSIVETGSTEAVLSAPRHPYTLGLIRSVPRLDRPREEEVVPIPGRPPDLRALLEGCVFAPRCSFAFERCLRSMPNLMRVRNGRRSACWLADQGLPDP
jgi:oligopeptide/dipeptide ABC transporter ATP-binding protein